nr:FAD-dependent oxidoreductase [Bifidobacterium catenulatum]
MTEQHFDIVIIGAGPGGYSTALRAAQLGKTVALVERDDTLGGTCLNRGCIPSKALLTAAHSVENVRQAERMGINVALQSIDFGRLRDFRMSTVETMTKGLAGLLSHRGVTVFRGEAQLKNGHEVHVAPALGETQVLRSIKAGVGEPVGPELTISGGDIVLATGSRPLPLPNDPFSGALIDSTQALELDTFPSSAVIIGAGAVALEFASLWNASGCKVTLLIRKDRVLSSWERRASMTLTRELKRHGVNVVARTSVSHVDTGANLGATVHYRQGDDCEELTAYGEVVLAAIGRMPNTDADWFASNGIALDERGYVLTDAYGRTNVEGVWALGDITPGHALAHRAFEQGITIAETIAGLDPKPVVDETVPQVVFSFPEAASVGLTLSEAKSRDTIVDPQETAYPMLSNSRMLMSGEGGSMTIVSGAMADAPDVPLVLGVHIVSPIASDMIAEAEQLVGNHVPLADAAKLIHPHPTFSESFGEALLKADGRPLHTR